MTGNCLTFKKGKDDPRNYMPFSLTSVRLGEIMNKVILGGIEKCLKDSAVAGHNQHSVMRKKSCLSNQISFYDKVTCLDD